MKLVRYEGQSGVGLGVVTERGITPLGAIANRFPAMLSLIENWDEAQPLIQAEIRSALPIPQSDVRLLSPLERPEKFLAIGMNYELHAEEARRLGTERPKHQLWFNKQVSCLSGPFDPIDPGVSEQLDYEAELGVIIGKRAKSVTQAAAPLTIFGYVVVNDVSARDWQRHSPTFTMGKSFDTHGPIGPWIVTADELPDPHHLRLRCWVNGELRQDSDTSKLIYNIWQQIAYLSTAFTLSPGDIIATGTPEGVGIAMTPPVFLKSGDVVRCEIERIGAIENKVI